MYPLWSWWNVFAAKDNVSVFFFFGSYTVGVFLDGNVDVALLAGGDVLDGGLGVRAGF